MHVPRSDFDFSADRTASPRRPAGSEISYAEGRDSPLDIESRCLFRMTLRVGTWNAQEGTVAYVHRAYFRPSYRVLLQAHVSHQIKNHNQWFSHQLHVLYRTRYVQMY